MVRDLIYGCALVAGCALGILLGSMSVRDPLKNVLNTPSIDEIAIPTMVTQDGTVGQVDILNRTILLMTTSPSAPDSTMPMRVTYDNATAFSNQFSDPISSSSIATGYKVRVYLSREPGALYAKRIITL